ncbi:BA75_01698T0 [Komagataella pastoris]|uniref:BA75_01698T0 n=1 Tax=Komagataella pastoris TaxID=4922 RepID=A0A1B2J7C5_PICPA|nr:BA75_01698T0 [Komagataella pastoris]
MSAPDSLKNVKHVILILSGKGGVGKSSITTQTALSLVLKGYKVGVLDIDLTGPSIPRMFGLEDAKIHQSTNGWVPAQYNKDLSIVSLGFLLGSKDASVVWRGPKKTAMIRQFLKDVVWPDLDYLLIDTPPGTSDEHIAIAEELQFANPEGCIIVTTPQQISISDVKKEINFCNKVNLRILGLVENMSGFICPHCAECTNIFSSEGGKNLASQLSLKYLGAIPIDPLFVEMIETQKGSSLLDSYENSRLYLESFKPIIDGVLEEVGK